MTPTPLNPYEQPLELGGIHIRRDEAGRYFLNDLHKAAGGKDIDKPTFFFRNTNTSRLVQALRDELTPGQVENLQRVPVKVINGGNARGTYVCRELVYAYAMWISPEFSIKVIRAYDQLATKGIAVHENHVDRFANDPMKMLGIIGEQMQKLMAERDASGGAATS